MAQVRFLFKHSEESAFDIMIKSKKGFLGSFDDEGRTVYSVDQDLVNEFDRQGLAYEIVQL